jgi:hypothetical protein
VRNDHVRPGIKICLVDFLAKIRPLQCLSPTRKGFSWPTATALYLSAIGTVNDAHLPRPEKGLETPPLAPRVIAGTFRQLLLP